MKITLFSLLLILAVGSVAAQTELYRLTHYDAMTIDTLDDDETVSVTDSRIVTRDYALGWLVDVDNISGTTAGTAYLEVSNCYDCSAWARLDTFAITASATEHLFVVNPFTALRARVRFVGTGTQATQLNNYVLWRRKD